MTVSIVTREFHLVAAKKGSFDTIVVMDIDIDMMRKYFLIPLSSTRL
jgi:hypothetical protein